MSTTTTTTTTDPNTVSKQKPKKKSNQEITTIRKRKFSIYDDDDISEERPYKRIRLAPNTSGNTPEKTNYGEVVKILRKPTPAQPIMFTSAADLHI